MQTRIVKIGNSQCLRIPKRIMQACNMTLDVEMHVKQDMLIITPDRGHRKSWDLKFSNSKGIAQDELLLDTISDLDSEEWEW